MNKTSLSGCKLYCIIDRASAGSRDPAGIAEAAVRGGADVIQWRDKESPDGRFLEAARSLRRVTRRLGVPFIVNDRLDAALAAQADGVHLGHEDIPVADARAVAGERLLIGRSTHSLEEALRAEADGADYIGVGPVFSTPTKPEYKVVGPDLVREVSRAVRIPWVAIGGIDLRTLPLVLSAGATRVAVVRAVGGAADPAEAARALKSLLTSHAD